MENIFCLQSVLTVFNAYLINGLKWGKEYIVYSEVLLIAILQYYNFDVEIMNLLDITNYLTLIPWGGGQNDPQGNKCLRNSEYRKKKIKKTTNLPHPPSSPLPP